MCEGAMCSESQKKKSTAGIEETGPYITCVCVCVCVQVKCNQVVQDFL
jgi:hypothetical protein